jgi:hypothetical protein
MLILIGVHGRQTPTNKPNNRNDTGKWFKLPLIAVDLPETAARGLSLLRQQFIVRSIETRVKV